MDENKKYLDNLKKNKLPNWYFKKGLILIDIFIIADRIIDLFRNVIFLFLYKFSTK